MSASASEQLSQTAGGAGGGGHWSQDEHDRYLEGLQLFPTGPWKCIADHVGTRSVRQVQTHAQKYHEKVARRLRGLRKERKKLLRPEHRIDDESLHLARELENERLSIASSVSGSSVSSSSRHSMDMMEIDSSLSSSSLTTVATTCGGRAPAPSYYFDQHHQQHHQYHEEYERHVAYRRRQYEIQEEGVAPQSSSSGHFQEYEYLGHDTHSHHCGERGLEGFARSHSGSDFGYQNADHFDRHHSHARDVSENILVVAHHYQQQQLSRRGAEIPSFSDCMDYLIEFFGSKEYNDAAWYRHHPRWR